MENEAGSGARKRSRTNESVERAVKSLQRGVDVDASFRVIYDAYYWKVRRLLERKGVPPEDRPDLIQTTFFRIYKGVRGLKNPSRFEAFLITTTHRVFLKWLERIHGTSETHGGRARVHPDNDEILDFLVSDEPWPVPLRPPPSPEERVDYRKLVARVARVIGEMPPAMRRCARLRFQHGLTNKEITEMLRKTAGDVGYQLFQARKRLAAALQGES